MISFKKELIDDFGSAASISRLDTKWEFITDRVMGGVSTGKMEFVQAEEKSCLHMTGNVSLKNKGGFIQYRTNLSDKRKNFDASGFDGIYVRAKGNGHTYAIHFRTKNTWFPWQFYQADFKANGTWQEFKIPFSDFQPVSLRKQLNIKKLKTVAIVAIKRRFKADILVDEIGFYKEKRMYKELTPEEERVIINKGTEPAFSGKYYNHFESGFYTCKRCGTELFESSSKFHSSCGWPSSDEHLEGAVKQQPDADGVRTEILCAKSGAHLGYVFLGEGFIPKNTRHCVNSISLEFVKAYRQKTATAIFASGCFWSTEYHFQKALGVISTTVGYTGGNVENPSYEQVCTDKTNHAEAVEVIYDPSKTTYKQLARLFFETHDFTQLNRQGPDIGKQYRSAIFYLDKQQQEVAMQLVEILKEKGFDVKTEIVAAGTFWPAEDYHQDYYQKKNKTTYCHTYRKLF